jgi:UDP-glucose 4-epimerase
MKSYAVTGGAGFIGSAIVRRLLKEEGARVAVIDNFLSGKESNLAGVRDRIEVHRADIRNYGELLPLFRGVDVVFHEAAIPSVPRSIQDPLPSHDVNINGTFQVYRAAADAGVRRVVYAAGKSPRLPRDSPPPVPDHH